MSIGAPKEENPHKRQLLCDDCGTEIFVDDNMVMVKDELWAQISEGNLTMDLCDVCMEKRMGRAINPRDFKPSDGIYKTAPCNIMWMVEQINKKPDPLNNQ
jgi:hypothetical protein